MTAHGVSLQRNERRLAPSRRDIAVQVDYQTTSNLDDGADLRFVVRGDEVLNHQIRAETYLQERPVSLDGLEYSNRFGIRPSTDRGDPKGFGDRNAVRGARCFEYN